MSLIVAWLFFPLLLGLLAGGCGLLVERISGHPLPGALILPVGLALIVVVSQAATYWDATAELATPLTLALALAGAIAGWSRLRAALPDAWAGAAAAGVFAVFAAPVVLSGEATFAGYTVLGDTSIHFILIDRLMEDGRELAGLPRSSYHAALSSYFGTAYPVGAHAALGAVRPLVGQDVAWVFQPFLAFMAALTGLSLYALVASFVEARWLRAAIAFLGAQPALVYAYSLQGSIKEVATVLLIATLVALVPTTVAGGSDVRRLVPLAITASAGAGVLGLAILPWLGPVLLACVAAIVWRRGSNWLRPTARDAVAFALLTLALSFPVVANAGDFVRTTVNVTVTSQTELGNLIRPLDTLQAFGIWPEGDYRLPLDSWHLRWASVLIGIGLAGGAFGLAWAVRRRAWLPILYAAISLIGWAYVTRRGSPWADAKALMIVSTPAVVTMLLGAVALLELRRRVEAGLLVAVVALGVLWSNALAYHDVQLAPRERLEELASIGGELDGREPTLYPEFEEFAKHFLRDGAPTGWSESWQPGNVPTGRFGFSGDVDEVPLEYLNGYRTLVLRRSPAASMPPSAFRRTRSGRWYDVWTKQDTPVVRHHVPLGEGRQPASPASCRVLRDVRARAAPDGGRIAYLPRPRRLVLSPARAQPQLWSLDAGDANIVHASRPGRIAWRTRLASGGRFGVWLEGSFGRETSVAIDGSPVGAVSYELNGRGQSAYLGEVALAPGTHAVTLSRSGGDLRPGNGGDRLLGPIMLSPPLDAQGRREVSSARWRGLCGRRLDWVEAVDG